MYNIIQVAAQASRRAIAFRPFNDTGSSAGPVKPSQRPIKHEIRTTQSLKETIDEKAIYDRLSGCNQVHIMENHY